MISERVAQLGQTCCARYVRQIANGTRIPSYSLAKALSAVTGGAVSVVQMMEWRRPDRIRAA
jgi:hypothetical protein